MNLPVQLTRFIGREHEIATVRQILGTTRLLTLTGAGGSGKTRLALEVATQLAGEYPDGLAWVELAALSDPELLPQQVATTLGVREEPGRTATEALLDFLRERSLLLVLDNCEHLADACAALVDMLLRGCPGLKILATSREALGVAGERAWLVPPLSLPDPQAQTAPEQLAAFEAVQLFVERAQDVLPSFQLSAANAVAVAQICRRLDGIPLAIELAAARVKVLAPEQIAQRLDNAFALLTSGSRTALPRHRTLRATIDWSYELLSEAEQVLLQRLSVFAGGFTLEAAEAVCADEHLEVWEVLDLLARLVDRSLVVVREQEDAARYHLLETVRQYARERVQEAGDAEALHRRHAEYFLNFAEAAEPHVFGGAGNPVWMVRLDDEASNLRAAADWYLGEAEDAEAAQRMFAAIHWYWFARGRFIEAREQLEAAVSKGPEAAPLVLAKARVALAYAALWQGDHASVPALLSDAVDVLRACDEPHLLAYALTVFGWSRLGTDASEADAILQEAVEHSRAGGPNLTSAVALYWMGFAAEAVGASERARNALDEAVAIGRSLGNRPGIAHPLNARGRIAILQRDYRMAASCLSEALLLHQQMGDRFGMIVALEGLAQVTHEAGAHERAARLMGAATAIRKGVGKSPSISERRECDYLLQELQDALGAARFASCFSAGQGLSFEEMVEYTLEAPRSATPAVERWERTAGAAPPSQSESPTASSDRSAPSDAVLRVLALGPLEIHRGGEILPPELWRYAKPKELLLYLLVHPEGRTKEQIGLVFWPDASAAQVKNSFHVTVHHLRKVLGRSDWIVIENERYRINEALGYEFDVDLFERQITEALREVRAGAGSADHLRAGLDLYRGDFLEEETVGDWHLETRDHLRRLSIEGLFALGDLLMQAEQWAEAAEVYQRIVRREDLHEEAHRRLILCLARAGERARALRHYERLVVLLRDELDAEPEEETTELYERLRQAEPV